MTEQEKFEQWWNKTKGTEIKHIGFSSFTEEVMFLAWQEAKQDSAAEIAELKEDMGHLDRYCGLRDTEIAQLQADNLKLRDSKKLALSLLTVNDMSDTYLMGNCISLAKEALASTPAQSLQDHDNEVIERCAVVGGDRCETTTWSDGQAVADAIRELKGKP